MSMARHAGPDNLSIEHVQRCEQGGGAVALVVMGHIEVIHVLQWGPRLRNTPASRLSLFGTRASECRQEGNKSYAQAIECKN